MQPRSRDRSPASSASDSHGCCSCTFGGHRQRHPDTGDRTPAGAAAAGGGPARYSGRGCCGSCGDYDAAASSGVALLRVRRLLVVEVVAAGVRMPSGAPAVIDIGTVAAVHRVGEALSGIILIIN